MLQTIASNPELLAVAGAVIVAAVSELLPFLPTTAQGIIHGILDAIRRSGKGPEAPKK